jgi:hypothetical protein
MCAYLLFAFFCLFDFVRIVQMLPLAWSKKSTAKLKRNNNKMKSQRTSRCRVELSHHNSNSNVRCNDMTKSTFSKPTKKYVYARLIILVVQCTFQQQIANYFSFSFSSALIQFKFTNKCGVLNVYDIFEQCL